MIVIRYLRLELIVFFCLIAFFFPFVWMVLRGYGDWMWIWEGGVLITTMVLLFFRYLYVKSRVTEMMQGRQILEEEEGAKSLPMSLSLKKELYSGSGNIMSVKLKSIKDIEVQLDRELLTV